MPRPAAAARVHDERLAALRRREYGERTFEVLDGAVTVFRLEARDLVRKLEHGVALHPSILPGLAPLAQRLGVALPPERGARSR